MKYQCNTQCFLNAYLDVVWQQGEDLLSGGAEDGPAAVGGVWQSHGLSQALQDGAAQGQTLGSKVLLELLQAQTLHVDLELILCNMLHPQAQALIQVSPSLELEDTYMTCWTLLQLGLGIHIHLSYINIHIITIAP